MERQQPKIQELKKFGLIAAVFIALFFGIIMPWLMSSSASYVSWGLSVIFVFMALLFPAFLTPIYMLSLAIGDLLGRLNTFIILLLVYCLLFIPIGIALRLLRYDPLQRYFESESHTYRIVRNDNLDQSSLENPF